MTGLALRYSLCHCWGCAGMARWRFTSENAPLRAPHDPEQIGSSPIAPTNKIQRRQAVSFVGVVLSVPKKEANDGKRAQRNPRRAYVLS